MTARLSLKAKKVDYFINFLLPVPLIIIAIAALLFGFEAIFPVAELQVGVGSITLVLVAFYLRHKINQIQEKLARTSLVTIHAANLLIYVTLCTLAIQTEKRKPQNPVSICPSES